jgi:pilus assembly protein Flp/PilA
MLQFYVFLQNFLAKPLKKDKGATAVEYGLMVAAIVAVIVTLVFTLGGYVVDAFTDTNDAWEVEVGP